MLNILNDYIAPDYVVRWEVVLEAAHAAAEKELSQVIDPQWALAHFVVRTVRKGAPFLEIIRYAKEKDIDLIVKHGRTGLTHLLLGSVAENVVRKAPCPVLTVHPKDHRFVSL